MLEISAVVLAGGKSKRLGVDKTLLRLDGEWLLERIIQLLAILSDDLLVVTNEERKFSQLAARVILDVRLGMGPLGGIYSGLQAMRYPRGLFVACDMPFLNLQLLRYMVLLSADFDVVIPRIEDNVEPLHAIYSKNCVQPIADLLDRGERRIINFFSQVQVRYVEQNEIDAFDPEHLSFFNINTRDELELAQELTKRRKS